MTPQDRDLIVRTVLGEAANQGQQGQAAVAAVIRNRLAANSPEFGGNTVPGVLFRPKAFEPWGARRAELMAIDPNSAPYQQAAGVVDQVLGGQTEDPTGGATHFLNADIVRQRRGGSLPPWAKGQTAQIGAHTFFAPNRPPQEMSSVNRSGAAMNQPSGPSDDDIIRLLSGEAPKAAPVTPQGQRAASAAPNPASNLPQWAVPKSLRGNAPAQGGIPDDEIIRLLTAGAPEPAPAKPKAPVQGNTPGAALARMAQGATSDSLTDKAARLGIGTVRGIGDVADTLAQGIGYAGEKGAYLLTQAGVIAPETAQGVADWRSRINRDISADEAAFQQELGDSGMATAGRIGGNIAATALPAAGAASAAGAALRPGANLLMRGAGLAAQGGAAGATGAGLVSSASDQPLGEQLTSGALLGGGLGVAGPAVVGAARGATNALMGSQIGQDTARLAQRARAHFGIPVTAGQMSESPAVKFLDSVLKRLPFSGAARSTERQTIAFNRAVGETFGENAERITPAVMQRARTRLGQEFDDIAANTTITADRQMANDLLRIANDARQVVADSEFRPIVEQIRNIIRKIDPNDEISGPAYQGLTRKGTPLDRAQHSLDPNVRHYASQVREALDDAMHRSATPQIQNRLTDARRQYRNMKTVEDLVEKSTTGDMSPALLMGRVRANSNNMAYGGGGELGDLARVGQRFLKEPPSSGTSERQWLQNALGVAGASGAGAYGYHNPDQAALGAGGLAAMLLAGRGAGAVLRSDRVANRMIQSGLGQQQAPGAVNRLLAAPYLPGLPASAAITQQRMPEPAPR